MEVPLDVAAWRSELVELTLDLLSVDTSNPPGDTREIVDLICRGHVRSLECNASARGTLIRQHRPAGGSIDFVFSR